MNLLSCAFIAFKNFTCKKKTMFKIISAYSIIVFSVICFFSYQNSVFSQINHIVSKSVSDCYIETDYPLNKADYPTIEEEKIFCGFSDDDLNIENISIILEGKEYIGKDNFSYDFEYEYSSTVSKSLYSVPFKIDAYEADGVIFSEFDKREFYDMFPENKLVLTGDLDINGNKIVMSDYILDRFGIRGDEAVEREITIKNNETGELYCKNLKLSGVINSKIFYTSANKIRAHIIISSDNITNNSNEPIYRYYCADYETTVDLAHKTKSRYNYALELYSSAEMQKSIVENVLSVIIVVLFIALIVWVITILFFYYRQQRAYQKILWSLGMKIGNSFVISLLELIYCLIVSGLCGVVLAVVFINVFNLYCRRFNVLILFDSANILSLYLMSAVFLLVFSAVVSFIGSVSAGHSEKAE